MNYWSLPLPRPIALSVWLRNARVWRKLLLPAVVMNFGEPILYLLGFGLGLGMFVGEVRDMPYLVFLASGIVASSAMTTASFEAMYSVFTRMVPQHTYDSLMATPLSIDDIVSGEILWCASKGVISSMAILAVGWLLDVTAGWQALLALPVVFLAGLSFAGPALMMSALATSYDFFNYYFVLIITPMLLLSGVFFPIEHFPAALQAAVQWLPLPHVVALARPLVAGQPVHDTALHLAVLTAYALLSYYFAVVMVRRRLLQ